MTDLPASIEAYLADAGFSQTEILVLKKLLEGEVLTLRELAAKTGKSTGVLDMAVKKLLARRIISREMVNDTPKLLLKSLDAVVQWVKRDTDEKLEGMKSRAKNFETFIQSLKIENARPEIEYFEGEEGIKKAYLKLLDAGTKELLHYRPVTMKEEEDPLAPFRVQYFRERYRRGIFARALASNTPLGRRFQSRDAFEYRETQLIPEAEFPITFEKIIAGEMVACFNHAESRVCLLKYSELAQTERLMFELLWRRAKEPVTQAQTVAVTLPQNTEPLIALSTRSLSSLREFFLSRKSVAIFAVGAALAGLVTFGLWRHTYNLNLQRERERALSIVATGAMQFDPDDLDKLHTIDDIKKPEYAKVIKKLNEIRSKNERVAYTWIFRKAPGKSGYWEYVADADSLDPFAKVDANHDGVIDDNDVLQYPGFLYDEFDPYFDPGAKGPFSTPAINSDQYGTYFTTSAPIPDTSGRPVTILGVDILISQVSLLTQQSFSYFLIFFGLFLVFVIVRMAAFNRSLFFDLLRLFHSKKILAILCLLSFTSLVITSGMYWYTLKLMKEKEGQRLMAIATTAAAEIDAQDLDPLRFARDMRRPEYQKVFRQLNEIRDKNENVTWVDIMRPTGKPNIWEFVADADGNFNIPLYSHDDNNNGTLDEADQNSWPGLAYDVSGQDFARYGLVRPGYEWAMDKWGLSVTGSAPIYGTDGKAVAVLDVTANITSFSEQIEKNFSPYSWFSITLFGVVGLWIAFLLLVNKIVGNKIFVLRD